MNGDWRDILTMLTSIKIGTDAQYVSFSTAPWGMRIQVDWEDNCHCIYGLGLQEIESANYQIIHHLVPYFISEHEKVKTK